MRKNTPVFSAQLERARGRTLVHAGSCVHGQRSVVYEPPRLLPTVRARRQAALRLRLAARLRAGPTIEERHSRRALREVRLRAVGARDSRAPAAASSLGAQNDVKAEGAFDDVAELAGLQGESGIGEFFDDDVAAK